AFPDGTIAGSTSIGLAGGREGRVQTMTVENGLPCVEIHSLLIDRQGGLWMYATCGIIFIAPDQLARWWQDPRAVLKVRLLDAFDGAQPSRPNFSPKASIGPDGRLWFANASIVQMVDPRRLDGNPV